MRFWGAHLVHLLSLSLFLGIARGVSTPVQSKVKAERFIVDTDPAGLVWSGLDIDDDLALLVLLAGETRPTKRQADQRGADNQEETKCGTGKSKAVDYSLLGVTTVAGNGPQRNTHANALQLLALVGRDDLPVHRGAGWYPPRMDSIRPRPQTDASTFIVETVMQSEPGTITLIALGPLTNVAAALKAAPALSSRLKQIIIMGGDLHASHLDLNFVTDRAAAITVLRSPIRKVLVPVQSCTQVAWTSAITNSVEKACASPPADDQSDARAEASGIRARGNQTPGVCELLGKMRLQTLLFPTLINRDLFPAHGIPQSKSIADGFVPWDVVAVLAVTHPWLFASKMELRNLTVDGWVMRWEQHTHEGEEEGEEMRGGEGGSLGMGSDRLPPSEPGAAVMYQAVDEEGALAVVLDLLLHCPSSSRPSSLPPPPLPLSLALGLLPELLGFVAGSVLLLRCMCRVCARKLNGGRGPHAKTAVKRL